jgi:hypothetical protein
LKPASLSALLIFLACGGIFSQETARQQQVNDQQRQTAQSQRAAEAQRQRAIQQRQAAETQSGTAPDPDSARFVIDVNPLMWTLSGIPDKNNNRSMFFDAGIQYNMLPGVSVRINPSISFGFTSETAFAASHTDFIQLAFPLTFICFPFSSDYYLKSVLKHAFFGISIIYAHYSSYDENGEFDSVGALLEIGYQIKLSNHLAITPSIGVSRVFPKRKEDGEYSSPNFLIYSPWPDDTPLALRGRLTLGFWI